MATTLYQPTASQFASATAHLERRADWRTYRVDAVRYVALQSASSGTTYSVRADAAGCSCLWYERTGRTCSHMYAVELAALEDELWEAQIDAALGPPAPKRASYADLFEACRDCGDLADGLDGRCSRCASDAEWEARRDAQRAAVGRG
jgi:hypothetical protein